MIQENRTLRFVALAMGLIALSALLLLNPYQKAPVNQVLGIIVMALGLAPAWRWLKSPEKDHVPVIALIGFFYAVCFGFAGQVTPDRFLDNLQVSESEYTVGLVAAILSLLVTYGGFTLGAKFGWWPVPQSLSRQDPKLDRAALRFLFPAALILDQLTSRFGVAELSQVSHTLRLFFFLWILHAAFTNRYKPFERRVVLWVLTPLFVALYSGLSEGILVGLLVFSQLIGLTYVAGRKRVPLIPILLAALAFFILQPVKSAYRREIWAQNDAVGPVDGLVRFVQLGVDHYSGDAPSSTSDSVNDAYSRINHLHTASAVIAETPVVGYRYGATYLPLLTKWVPRAIWKNKPLEDLGNRWAKEYGFLSQYDDSTSFNLPWLPEMFMNFGWFGIVGISFLIGLISAAIWSVFVRSASSSQHFAAGLLLCSSFFFPESNLSIDIGNMMISLMVILAASWGVGTLFSGSTTQVEPSIAWAAANGVDRRRAG
jgi:hypothetical protein